MPSRHERTLFGFAYAFAISVTVTLLALMAAIARANPVTHDALPVPQDIYRTLTGIPRSWSDRELPAEEMRAHRQAIARAIGAAAQTPEERAALLAVGQHESHFSTRIGRDECAAGECDPDATGRPLARGVWQLHRAACEAAWDAPPDFPRLVAEAHCAVIALHAAKAKCGGTWERAIAGYRGSCKTGDTLLRERTYRTLLDVVQHGWPSAPAGWVMARPSRDDRRAHLSRLRTTDVRDFVAEAGVGVLTDWHYHDPSSGKRPMGWHKGLTFFREGE